MTEEYSLVKTAGRHGCGSRQGIGISSSAPQRNSTRRVMHIHIGGDVLSKMGLSREGRLDVIVSPSTNECKLVKAANGRVARRKSDKGTVGSIKFTIRKGVPYTESLEECEILELTEDIARFRLPKNTKWGE